MNLRDRIVEAVMTYDYRTAIKMACQLPDAELLGHGPTIRRGLVTRGPAHEQIAARQAAISAIEAYLRGDHA